MVDPVSDKMPHELFGDGSPPATTRDRLLEHAQDLFYSRGFHAVGIEEIVRRAGVTKATFYNHFESRDDLIVEVIRRSDRQFADRFREAVRERAGWDAGPVCWPMFDVLDEWFSEPAFRGCVFVTACMAYPNRHDPIHKAASAHYLVVAEDVAAMAEAAGLAETDEFARMWVVLIQGATTHHVVTRAETTAKTVRRAAEVLLEQWPRREG